MPQATATTSTPKKYQGFVTRQQEDEDELKKLEEERATILAKKEEEEAPDSELTAEEATYKKRYGDLRSYQQRKQKESEDALASKEAEIEALKRQITEKVELPASQEELEEFMRERPDVARVIETMIAKRISKQEQEIADKLKQLEGDQNETKIERAKVQLLNVHPDLEELENDQEFHAWVISKSPSIQEAIYDNPTDWRSAADAISLYKLETGKNKKSSTKKLSSAATNVSVPSATNAPSNAKGKVWKESDLARMSDTEYEKHAEEIDEAVRAGNFEYDISGGAR